ncbi:hypothetical protein PV433_08620 [Paenibacillus sp. GYB004]|uniref:hypothetical protein n=1 Tax=Paenibacillus sp. GYB004 TaxID=2994393 RepID=UPI002F968082
MRGMRKGSKRRLLAALIAAVLIMHSFPVTVAAAGYELSATMKKSFDKMADAAGGTFQRNLGAQYGELTALQQEHRKRDADSKELRIRNDEALKVLRRQIKQLDESHLAELKRRVDDTKARYKPMLDMYTSINQQITTAKKLHSKEWAAILQIQANGMKAAVQLAKQDIRNKEAQLTAAKGQTSAKQKKIRETLTALEPVDVKMRTHREAVTRLNKQVASDWKTFTPHVKQQDAKASSEALSALLSRLRQISDHKRSLYDLEAETTVIINKAKTQLSKL